MTIQQTTMRALTPPLAATPNSSTASGYNTGSTVSGFVQSSPNTVITATGGTGSYTYSWAQVSGDTMSIVAPTSASTSFTATVNYTAPKTAVMRCTISDGASTVTVDVTVTLTYDKF